MLLKRVLVFCIFCLMPILSQGAATQSLTFSLGKSEQNFDSATSTLLNLGYTNLILSGEKSDTSWKISYSHPLSSKLSANLSWIDLGGVDIKLEGTLPSEKSDEAAAQEVAKSLPVRGKGVAMGLFMHHSLFPYLDLNAGAGLFTYTDTRKATVGTFQASEKSSGSKPYSHIGLNYKVKNNLGITAEWERFFLDDDVDHFGVGLSYLF